MNKFLVFLIINSVVWMIGGPVCSHYIEDKTNAMMVFGSILYFWGLAVGTLKLVGSSEPKSEETNDQK